MQNAEPCNFLNAPFCRPDRTLFVRAALKPRTGVRVYYLSSLRD